MKDIKVKTVGFRVTEDELNKLEMVANENNETVSEWCRRIALKAANREDNIDLKLINLGDRILLEQLVLLRFLLSTTLGDKELTDDKLKRIIKKANEMKREKAQELIKEFMSEDILEG